MFDLTDERRIGGPFEHPAFEPLSENGSIGPFEHPPFEAVSGSGSSVCGPT